MKDVLVKYTCAAYPPEGITMDKCYTVGKDDKGYYYAFLDNKTYADIEFIKMLFTPNGKTWAEVVK